MLSRTCAAVGCAGAPGCFPYSFPIWGSLIGVTRFVRLLVVLGKINLNSFFYFFLCYTPALFLCVLGRHRSPPNLGKLRFSLCHLKKKIKKNKKCGSEPRETSDFRTFLARASPHPGSEDGIRGAPHPKGHLCRSSISRRGSVAALRLSPRPLHSSWVVFLGFFSQSLFFPPFPARPTSVPSQCLPRARLLSGWLFPPSSPHRPS